MKVQKLDDSVINQIKYHLRFNTIDSIVETILRQCLASKATRISIKIDLQSLAVFIQSDDVGHTPDQLEQISTRGKFGGLEVVSHISIISKSSEYQGCYKIAVGKSAVAQLCNESDLTQSYFKPEAIREHGTIYIVSNIFNNLPVRQMQLQSTPVYKIINEVKLALLKVLLNKCQDCVNLELYNPKKFIFEQLLSTSASSQVQLLQDLFDIEVAFKPVKAKFQNYSIDGIIGLQLTSSKPHQYIFINGNLMTLSKNDVATFNDIFEDFGQLDPSPKRKLIYKHPTFLISITCAKEVDEQSYSWRVILDILKRVFTKFVRMGGVGGPQLKQGVNDHELTLLPSPKRAKTDKFILNTNMRWGNAHDREIEGMISCGNSHHIKPPHLEPPCTKNSHKVTQCNHNHTPHSNHESIQFDKLHLTKYRIIKQIDNKFILLIIDTKLVVLDQHAADERVRVEQLMQEFVCNMPRNLRLAQPIRIRLSSSEYLLLQQYIPTFKSLGISYHFDDEDNNLVITNLPELLISSASDVPFMKSILIQHCIDLQNNIKSQLNSSTTTRDWFAILHHLPQFVINLINSRACRSAIMFGDELSISEMHQLIDNLAKCRLPFQCAHGRPSIVPLVNLQS